MYCKQSGVLFAMYRLCGHCECYVVIQAGSPISPLASMSTYPVVVGTGCRGNLNQVFLLLEGQATQVPSLLCGIDRAFKAHYLFNITYNKASEHIWQFLQKAVYSINDDCPVFAAVRDLQSYIVKKQWWELQMHETNLCLTDLPFVLMFSWVFFFAVCFVCYNSNDGNSWNHVIFVWTTRRASFKDGYLGTLSIYVLALGITFICIHIGPSNSCQIALFCWCDYRLLVVDILSTVLWLSMCTLYDMNKINILQEDFAAVILL
jgi:hypothetical protein